MISIELISFVCDGYEYQGEQEPGRTRKWFTPDGDGFGVFFFPLPPDLPANASSVDEIAAYYESLLGDSGGRLAEIAMTNIDGCPAVQTIISVPQEPSGHACVGSITIPFRDFSFVLKVQCTEHGITGAKEAILLDRKLKSGEEVKLKKDGRLDVPDWHPDSKVYDSEFPDHPVARARRVLRDVTKSTLLAHQAKNAPKFALPKNGDN